MTTTPETPDRASLARDSIFTGHSKWRPRTLSSDAADDWDRDAPEAPYTDHIVRWDEVRDGDLVLGFRGELDKATVLPQGSAWQPEGCVSLMIGGTWYTPRRDKLTAVRRYITEGA